jgi:hypothetical protein
MRRWLAVLVSYCLIVPAFADPDFESLLNKVTLQLTSEQWVATKTALVTVGINASVSDKDLGKIQMSMLEKLNQLADKADWHIVSFDRTQDQSGLEKVQASAQVRLPESALSGIRDKAKTLSKPGETFTLDNVQFIPSDEELRVANAALRNSIYQQAKAEIDQLNKDYPEQKYYLHQISFMGGVMMRPMPQNVMMMNKTGGDAGNANFAVGDKLRISAQVVLAAAPNPDVTKVVHN